MQKKTSSKTRRATLKSLGAVTGLTTLAATASAKNSADLTAYKQECEESKCPKETIREAPIAGYKAWDGKAALHWHSSEWYGGSLGWNHRFSMSIGGAEGGEGSLHQDVMGQRFKVQCPDKGVELFPTSENRDQGVYPNGNSGQVADWGMLTLETVVGTFVSAASWFTAAGDVLHDKLAPAEGMDTGIQDGFKHTKITDWGWAHCCSFHLAEAHTDLFTPEINARGSLASNHTWSGYTSWRNTDFDLEPGYSHPTSHNPEDLRIQDKEELGIKKVPDDVTITTEVDGEEVEARYIAEESPFKNIDVSHSTTRERTDD